MGYETENTLKSIQKGIELGTDMIEIDLQQSSNGELFVFHDRRIDRLTNKEGIFENLSSNQINQLNLSNKDTIPSLIDVLNTINGITPLILEIKSAGISDKLGNILRDYTINENWKPEDFLISSFNHNELKSFKKHFPEYRVGVLLYHLPHDLAKIGSELNAYSIHCSIDFISKELVQDAHNRGLKVFIYTINNQEDYQICKNLDVDGIFSNYPDIFR